MQFSMTWDASQMSYVGAENVNSNIGGIQFNQTGTNELGLTWNTPNGFGVSIPNGTTLFSLCFDVNACTGPAMTGALNFVDGSVVSIEIINGNTEEITPNFQPCGYSIICDPITTECDVNFGTANITPTCLGDNTGAITINPTVTGTGCTLASCTWFQAGGPMIPTTGCNLSGVPPGEYILRVTTSGGNSEEMSFMIPAAGNLTITGQEFPVTCNSLGGVNTTITGGSGNYSCIWPHNGAVGCNIGGLESGVYTLQVTDMVNGCTQEAQFAIGTDHMIVATATASGADCGGGTISVTVDQAGPFNYAWSHDPNATGSIQNNLATGTYTITVTDDDLDCSTTTSATVTATTSSVAIEEISSTDVSCDGNGSGDFNIVGG